MNSIIKSILVLSLLFGLTSNVSVEKKRIQVVIVTGQNNHNWQVSSKMLKQIYDSSELFNATIVTSPAEGEDMSGFNPDFSKFDLICLDYNGDSWTEKTQKNFVNFIKKGGGFVSYHASDNSFPNWEEYNRMIGVGGWRKRNELNGPILYWDGNTIKKDSSSGVGGAHGKQQEYIVYHRKPNHPILEGLPSSWLHTKDELYHSLRGPAEELTVLATAEQDKAGGGSGRQEPVLMTIKYEKGRVFHTTLGHVGNSDNLDAILCEGFITTLLRGSEWAATGKVTQDLNKNFPTKNKTSLWVK